MILTNSLFVNIYNFDLKYASESDANRHSAGPKLPAKPIVIYSYVAKSIFTITIMICILTGQARRCGLSPRHLPCLSGQDRPPHARIPSAGRRRGCRRHQRLARGWDRPHRGRCQLSVIAPRPICSAASSSPTGRGAAWADASDPIPKSPSPFILPTYCNTFD